MNIFDILMSAGGKTALQSVAKSYGVTPQQLDAILAQVVPALSNRMERNTLSRGGVADLLSEMMRPDHKAILADPARAATPAASAAGIQALDTVFGDKAVSRNVAARAASSSGVSQAIIQKLLPIIASIVMAALAKGTQGGLGDILKKLPDLMGGDTGAGGSAQPDRRRQRPAPEPNDGGLGDILSKIPGLPGNAPPSEPSPLPGAGQPFPQQQSGPFGGGSPLPLPGDNIPQAYPTSGSGPLGDLPDVIRRGGTKIDGGGSVGGAVRDILGSVLGFQSKGFLGWIIRLIVLRWGWGFVQRILSRVLLGR